MIYRVVRPFGARKVGETVHDDAFHNVRYLLAAGMIEPVAAELDPEPDATTKPPQGARTKSKKPKTKE
jgi:hypothetical protein